MPAKHLSPFALVFELGKLIKGSWPALFAFVIGARRAQGNFFWILIAGIVLVTVLTLVSYWMTTYQILDRELILRKGIINRQERHVPYDRIQNLERRQWFFLEPFKLESLSIDTGASDVKKSALVLSAVPESVAETIEKLRHQVLTDEKSTDEVTPTESVSNETGQATISPKEGVHGQVATAKYQVKVGDLVLYGITDTPWLASFAAIWALSSELHLGDQIGRYGNEAALKYGLVAIAGILIFVLLAVMAFNLVKVVLRYYGYTVARQGDNLTMKGGLLKTDTIHVTLKRIQAVEIGQSFLRRLLRLVTVNLLLIKANEGKENAASGSTVLIPVVPQGRAYQVGHPLVHLLPEQAPKLEYGDAYACWLRIRNGLIWAVIPVIAVAFFYHGLWWGLASALWLLGWGFNGFYAGHYTTTAQLNEEEIVLRRARLLGIGTTFVGWHEIQSMNLRQSIWMKKRQRAHISIAVRQGGSVTTREYKYLPLSQAQAIFDWYRDFA
ncbi:PH domain-containing protein [Lactobacillaceae bacterium L1_55_11]|nr:PH domain-containing protein [Lactobacillaceae bacterium L1_55_11]